MSDRRTTPSNGRVAATHLRGKSKSDAFTDGIARQVCVPALDLLDSPGGRRDRQLVYGQTVTSFETRKGWSFVQAHPDGYVGYVHADALRDPLNNTHVVSSRATHIYSAADFKSPELSSLSLGSRVLVTSRSGRFAETPAGFIPATHLSPAETPEPDPVSVAERLLGTPYLWGGNSAFGIDCSGLIQIACHACGMACPGDSDMQETQLGTDLGNRPPRRGDLFFWKGHVAWVASDTTLLHANAHHMAVAHEDMAEAITRIETQGDGSITSRKRLGGTT